MKQKNVLALMQRYIKGVCLRLIHSTLENFLFFGKGNFVDFSKHAPMTQHINVKKNHLYNKSSQKKKKNCDSGQISIS